MRRFLKVLLGLGLVVVVVGVIAYFSIDKIAEAGVEKGGTYALGVKTEVKGVILNPFAGKASISDLDVANPEGFNSQSFLTMKKGDCSLKLDSLFSKTVMIPSLELSDVDLVLEQGLGKSNYSVILEHLRGLESGERPRGTEEGKKYVIDEVNIRNVRVKTSFTPLAGQKNAFELAIPSVHLTKVGSESGSGIPIEEVYAVVIRALLDAVAKEGGGRLPQDMQSELNQGLDRLRETLKTGPGGLPRPADLPQIPGGIFGGRKSEGGSRK